MVKQGTLKSVILWMKIFSWRYLFPYKRKVSFSFCLQLLHNDNIFSKSASPLLQYHGISSSLGLLIVTFTTRLDVNIHMSLLYVAKLIKMLSGTLSQNSNNLLTINLLSNLKNIFGTTNLLLS